MRENIEPPAAYFNGRAPLRILRTISLSVFSAQQCKDWASYVVMNSGFAIGSGPYKILRWGWPGFAWLQQ